ncbi:PREDICTED: R3H domain-containing protein 1-like [Amphimedon queenslandica]|nr:PREDICTED: R3H domain-containing protein 1-like [Amphimedon queenslandica]|eukprot:XP_011410586.1 PREDICTED: R3H domain-containing protein 1-like [Amphimedon queenslandica]
MKRRTKNKEKDSEERQRGFKNHGGSNQRDEYNQGRRTQGGWSSERGQERHQQRRQRNNEGRQDGRRERNDRGRDDNDWEPNEGNRPTGREEKEAQTKNEDSTKKDDSVNECNATSHEGESQSLFSFSSSRVFSLSGNDRLVVREVDHTSGRRVGRGRGRGRGITSGSKDIGLVGKTMTQSVSSNGDPPVTSNNTVTSSTGPLPHSGITNNDGNDKPAQEANDEPEGQETIAGDPMESNEVDSKGGPAKPKRYSSRRQKPDQAEGADSADKTMPSTGMEYPPPPPFGYGWVYPPHPSMIPHQVDPSSYQAQQQQLHYYQQHMRLLQDMYSQHTGGAAAGANPPLIPLLPHLMGPQDQFTLLPSPHHFPPLTPPPPRYPLSTGDLKPSPTVDSSHESSPSPAVVAPAATEKKPSQAIPIVAPTDVHNNE